jgi:hypothetical protein
MAEIASLFVKIFTWVYALNAALLVAHEVDSAYWREWELFGLGGGIGGFVLLHVPLVLLILWGFERLLAGARAGLFMSAVLGLSGLAAPLIHGFFLYRGHTEFRTPVSFGLLCAIGLASLAQLALAARAMRASPVR